MDHDIKLKTAVMQRVYVIYWIRQLLSAAALRLYALIALSAALYVTVSVREVIANMPGQGIVALYNFFLYAVVHTEMLVQLILLGIIAVVTWVARDIARSIAHLPVFRRTI